MRTAASKKTERSSSESSGIQPDSVKLTVRLIDGAAFRGESLDKQEFGNWATSYEYDEIPANAVWVDERVSKTDLHFFLLNAEAYLGALKAGYSVDESAEYGLATEQSERERSSEGGGDHPYHDEIIQDIYIQLQQTLPGDEEPVEVWLVDGTMVRGISKTDFVEGGHAYVYPWIPEKEIWIEQDVAEEEREFVILHEHTERSLMRNELLGYDEAHKRASKVEFAARQKAQQGDKYYDIERAGNTEPVQLPPAELIRTVRACPVCGAQAKSIPGGWRCGTPPCEWSLLQAGGDSRMEKAVATVDGLGIDPQGGVEPTDLAKAEAADLITLPKGTSGTNCGVCQFYQPIRDLGLCKHPKVDQMVNRRMCCIYWDSAGTYRAWKSDHQTKDGNVFGIEPIRPQPEHPVPEPHEDETGTIDKALSAYNETTGGALVPPPAQGTAMTLRRKYGRTRSLLGKKSLDPPRVSSSSVGRAPLTVQGGSSGVRPAPAPHHAQPSPTPSAHSTPSSAGKAPSPKTSGSSPSQRAPVRETTPKPAAAPHAEAGKPAAPEKPTTVKPERPRQTTPQPAKAPPAKVTKPSPLSEREELARMASELGIHADESSSEVGEPPEGIAPKAEKRTNEDGQHRESYISPIEAMGLPETDEDEPYLDLDDEDEGTIPRGEPVAEPHRPEAPSIPPSRLAEQRAAPSGWGSIDHPQASPAAPSRGSREAARTPGEVQETPAAARHQERIAEELQHEGSRLSVLGEAGRQVHLDPIASGSEEDIRYRWENNEPLPLPDEGDAEVQRRLGPAWDIVSRLWPEMARQLPVARMATPAEEQTPQLRVGTAALNTRTGAGELVIPRNTASVPPEILWHELVHLEQLRNGVLDESPMYHAQGGITEHGRRMESEAHQRGNMQAADLIWRLQGGERTFDEGALDRPENYSSLADYIHDALSHQAERGNNLTEEERQALTDLAETRWFEVHGNQPQQRQRGESEAPTIPPSRLAERNLVTPTRESQEFAGAFDEVTQRTGPAYGVNPENYASPNSFATDAMIAATIANPGMTSAERQTIYQAARDYFVAQQERGEGNEGTRPEMSRQQERRSFPPLPPKEAVSQEHEDRPRYHGPAPEGLEGLGDKSPRDYRSQNAFVQAVLEAVNAHWQGNPPADVYDYAEGWANDQWITAAGGRPEVPQQQNRSEGRESSSRSAYLGVNFADYSSATDFVQAVTTVAQQRLNGERLQRARETALALWREYQERGRGNEGAGQDTSAATTTRGTPQQQSQSVGAPYAPHPEGGYRIVHRSRQAAEQLNEIIGKLWAPGKTDQDVVRLTGMPTDAHAVSIRHNRFDKSATVMVSGTINGHRYDAQRTIYFKRKEIHNDYFKLDKKLQKTGIGTLIFAKEVAEAVQGGFETITTLAARSPTMNGYYTWPRIGYDAAMPEALEQKLRRDLPDVIAELDIKPDEEIRLLDLLISEKGGKWWEKNGTTVNMEFDLRAGSRNHRVLKDAVTRAEARQAAAKSSV